ncbi:helix-hairpin-helix domain-containing protein [Sphingobacterium sp. LRF_L2]|uniref:helix-hairpin-helix domain-containing protein n=1 Tax=Sphingobacterium sp. LRF_L2 TaxID=3369421 RepID=UPI003F6069DE
MYFNKFYFILCLQLVGNIFFVVCQETEIQAWEEQLIEEIVANLEQEVDVSEWTERLRYYVKHPMDLNTVNSDKLADLLFLSPLQITNLLAHRSVSGRFYSVLELQSIDGFDKQTIDKLLPFVVIAPGSYVESMQWKDIWEKADHSVMFRYGKVLEKQKGYGITDTTRSRYLGDANRYMFRYRLNFSQNIQFALNMEKDAGEPFFSNKQQLGFDHYGMSLFVKGHGVIKHFVLGDYSIQAGQGLVMWNGLSFGKGAMITSGVRQGTGLRSYTSMNEHSYLRGTAVTLSYRGIEVTPFISMRRLSGSITSEQEGHFITSISSSGLHRTPTELANRHTIKQFTSGLTLLYHKKRLQLGAVGVYSAYNGTILSGTALRNLYDFEGDQTANAAVNYQFTFRNAYLFGETAFHANGGWATINGGMLSLHPNVSAFVNYRNYSKSFYTTFGQALGEGSAVANEKGIYAGAAYILGRKIEWVSYLDVFEFPWLRYRVSAPSVGMDFLSQFTYKWYRKGRLSIRYRHRLKEEDSSESLTSENIVEEVLKRQLRLEFHYKLSKIWEIRSRLEGINYRKATRRERGGLFYQDVFFRSVSHPISANFRVAIFNTDSYESRLYAYENDVLYAGAFPLYSGKGWRSYINVRYSVTKSFDFWMRYSHSNYFGVESVGSGLDESTGNKRSDIKLQCRYRW